jgi:PAS domain S-box-containing protein
VSSEDLTAPPGERHPRSLEEAGALYRRIVETTSEGIWIVDPEGHTAFANPAIARMLGYTPEEMRGRNAFEFLFEEDKEEALRNLQLRRQGQSAVYEFRLRHRDGSAVWTTLAASPIQADDGQFLGVLAMLTEITAKKKMEAALRESVDALEAIVEACPLAIITLDRALRVLMWSRGAHLVFGWEQAEVLGRPLPTVPEQGRPAFRSLLEDQLLESSPKELELRLVRKDGVPLDASAWVAPLRGEDGSVRAILIVLADTTARKKGEEDYSRLMSSEKDARAQARAERRFRELLEAAPDAIIEVDREGRIVLMNALTEKMFGYGREELIGQTVEALMPVELQHTHIQHRAEYWRNPLTRPMGTNLSLLARRKDGSAFPVEISLSPVGSEKGFRVTAIIRDVSERKQAEQEIRRIQERFTAELAAKNRELQQRSREAERASQLKSEFLASMSHELRTPLHTIIGFAELMLEEDAEPLTSQQRRFLGHVQQDSRHLLELINDLLDLSKIEAGRLELRPEEVGLFSALAEVLNSIRPLAVSRSITLEEPEPQTVILHADPLRIKEILYNLLSNAVKFTPAGGRVWVTVEQDHDMIHVAVNDTGMGIKPEEQQAIFDKFYQTGSTTRGVREGTGLGLAITKHLVEMHGGTIGVESEPGKGSKFKFSLPKLSLRNYGVRAGGR